MNKKLYHGTNYTFGKIDLSKSKPNKDFGPGFYLTDDYAQAQNMALFKAGQEGGSAMVHTYRFDEEALLQSSLKTLRFDTYNKEWAEFILLNRDLSLKSKRHDYDFVYGPIANDKVGLQVKLFQQSLINIETLLERLKYIRITFQYYFGTDQALTYLKNEGLELC